MSSHSDEIWESFDALWRRVEQLSRHVTELETKLAAIEGVETRSIERAFKAEANVSERLSGVSSYEGEIHR